MEDVCEQVIKHLGELLVPTSGHAFVHDEFVSGHSSAFHIDGLKVHGEVALQHNSYKTLKQAGKKGGCAQHSQESPWPGSG